MMTAANAAGGVLRAPALAGRVLAALMEPPPSSAAPAARDAAVAGELSADGQDVALMQRVRAGDREAFAVLVELHQARVIGTVARMLGPEGAADAEDVAQQVFLRVWKSAARYQATAKFTTWLFTIARNLVFNELRRRRTRPTVSLDALVEDFGALTPPAEDRDAGTPDAALLEGELRQAIDDAIAQLPEAQRLALILRRYEELPYEEIARVLDLTVPSVKSLLFRARGELRQRLVRYLEG